ncbi:MAG: hypothetical protein ACK4OP_14715, partial [Gemmobacter sp.]
MSGGGQDAPGRTPEGTAADASARARQSEQSRQSRQSRRAVLGGTLAAGLAVPAAIAIWNRY